jgi:hypothetical protein
MVPPELPNIPIPALPSLPFLEEKPRLQPSRRQRRRFALNVLNARSAAAPRMTLQQRREESQRYPR